MNIRLAPEFFYYLEDSSPHAIFFDGEHQAVAEMLKTKFKAAHYVCFDLPGGVGLPLPTVWKELPSNPLPEIPLSAFDPQLIIYTSGTTGVPEGVILTHGMITWNAINTNLGWDLRSDDRTALHSSLFYTAGWNVFTLPLFHCRGTNVLVRGFDADLILDLIERERLTLFFGVPTMFQMLLESPRFGAAIFPPSASWSRAGRPMPRKILKP